MNLIGKAKSLRFFDPDLPPPHMDKWTRNARAAEWLVGMGF